MESITKNRQPIETIRAMVERAYGPGSVPPGDDWVHEEGHGWFNVVYRIALADGRTVGLKIAPPPQVEVLSYEHQAMRVELAALALVEQHTSVPVPRVDHADLTHELVDADWFAMSWAEGDNLALVSPELSPEQEADYNRQLGALNRELNGIRGTAFGRLENPTEATWRQAFGRMFAEIVADGRRRGVPLGHDTGADEVEAVYAEVEAIAEREAHWLDEVTEPRFVEWDLWDGNCIVRADDGQAGRIVCVIDHERGCWGDPLFEAGFTGLTIPVFGDPSDFMAGYGLTTDDLDEAAWGRRRLYGLYLMLVMVIETNYRGHTDPSQYDWAREQLAGVLADYRGR